MKPTECTILAAVCNHFGVTNKYMIQQGREYSRSYPRQVAMYLLKSILDYSFCECARALHRTDHTTARHAFIKIGKAIYDGDEKITADVGKIRDNLSKLATIPPSPNSELVKICGDMAATLRQVAEMLDNKRERMLANDLPRLFGADGGRV